jgi:3-dehydroquinate synthase
MKTIKIDLGIRSYPIYVGQKLLGNNDLILRHLPQKKVAIVTNATVSEIYLKGLVNLLSKDKEVISIVLPD